MVLLDDDIHEITSDHYLRYSPAQKILMYLEFATFSNFTSKTDSSFMPKTWSNLKEET